MLPTRTCKKAAGDSCEQVRATRYREAAACNEPTAGDACRVLVDRFRLRGRCKLSLKFDEWARELAPSAEWLCWLRASPESWEDFLAKCREELGAAARLGRLQALLAADSNHRVTLVYGATNPT